MKTSRSLLLGIVLGSVFATPDARAQGTPEIKPALVHGFNTGATDFDSGVVLHQPSGQLFGLSKGGGALDRGALFNNGGSGQVIVVASFGDPDGPLRGEAPTGRLFYQLADTLFYGVTKGGGRFGFGTLFSVSATGTGTTLVDFSGADGAAPGFYPTAGLTAAPDGTLYGVTEGVPKEDSSTDIVDFGSVFRYAPATGRFEVVVKFAGTAGAAPGAHPAGPVLVLADGSLVGTTKRGGKLDRGTIFHIAIDGTFTSYSFTKFGGALPGSQPLGRLFESSDGSVFGVAAFRSLQNFEDFSGLLWKLPPGGPPVVALEFGQAPDFPSGPGDGLTRLGNDSAFVLFRSGGLGGRGGLYTLDLLSAPLLTRRTAFNGTNGAAIPQFTTFTGDVVTFGSGLAISSRDQIFEIDMGNSVNPFVATSPDDNTGEGSRPVDPVFFDQSQNLYQRTNAGGANGRGTIVQRLGLAGPIQPLTSLPAGFSGFSGQPLAIDGSTLLIPDRLGGANGSGRILQIDGSGIVTERAVFDGVNTENPVYGLTPDGIGNFYGQAFMPGSPALPAVYRLTGSTITRIAVVGAFDEYAYGPLTPLGDGNHFLGVQNNGGTNNAGRIFKVGIGGNVTTFTTFGTAATGSKFPIGPLFREPSGSFVLPAYALNSNDQGTIVRIAQTGAGTKLGSASAAQVFGANELVAPVVEDAQGRLYGLVNQHDDSGNHGVLYRADLSGKVTLLYRFRVGNAIDDVGFEAGGGLTLGPGGAIYGNTVHGGRGGGGAIFKVFPDPQATAATNVPDTVLANSASLTGELTNNGFNTEYWFTFGAGALDQETAHVFTGGFHGTQSFAGALSGLKGHTQYTVQFNSKVGFGTDAITATGNTITFTTPNGAPVAQDDTILVTTANPGDEFTGEVLDNDSDPVGTLVDPDGDPLAIDTFTQPTYGVVTQVGDTLVYAPTADFFDPLLGNGKDTFTYVVKDDQAPPKTAMATVTVLAEGVTVGEYAGLLFDDSGADGIPREGAAIPSPDQIAAGFAQFAVARGRRFSARFVVGGRTVTARGSMAAGRNTRVSGRGFGGSFRPAANNGIEARITINGRTLVLRAGQAFAAVAGAARPKSDFTMRLEPNNPPAPVGAPGEPAGTGFAVVRQGANARATLVGALPDGTTFSAKTIIDPDGRAPFLVNIKKGRDGTFDGELIIDTAMGTVGPAAGTTARWRKFAQARATRFPSGFTMRLNPSGRKYTVPAKGLPPLDLMGGGLHAIFDRGGIFAPLNTRFIFNGTKAVVDGIDEARATAKFDGRTGLVSGTFKPGTKAVKYRGVLVLTDNTVAGFFLGPADAGSVSMAIVP